MSGMHQKIEKNVSLMIVLIVLVVSVGGLVEIVPLFFQKSTTEPVAGLKPYGALQLTGRDVYVREGCYNCHSQMIRPLRDEVERYGHYSLAAESMYDRPFQWGSKRTGPDLARVGGKYSDLWHVDHLNNPQSVVPTSIMPSYSWLARTPLDAAHIEDDLRVQQLLGVPYTDEMIAEAKNDLATQGSAEPDDLDAFLARYPNANVRDFTGPGTLSGRLSEADALIAYLQSLGTAIDFSLYDDKVNIR
jgi:cytochrome c oxidase cbb3-type subunit 2